MYLREAQLLGSSVFRSANFKTGSTNRWSRVATELAHDPAGVAAAFFGTLARVG
jgi:hypothetical protein